MVGLGSQSRGQTQNPAANDKDKHSLVLSKGKLVEVSSDEEGFKGAWYLATIVETPPKSNSKKRKMVTVEYKTLLKEDLSPLVEPVDPVYIRPLPRDNFERVFEVNDVVDAGYRDGWWTGVVRKVLEGPKYRVYFDNPPDIMDFDGKDLRTHFEWVNGNWVKSEKQNTTGSSIFSSGTGVEVNVEKENVRDAWFPGVVVKENADGTFLVKHQIPGYNNDKDFGSKVEAVDSHHIRPIPPRYADRDFELLEKVDTPYYSGWRPGLITKLLAGRMYNVFFKQVNEQKEFNYSEIRPNAEWVKGKWDCKSKEVLIAPNNEKQLDSSGQPELKLGTNGKGEEKPGATNGKDEKKAPCSSPTGEKTISDKSTRSNEKSSSHVLPLAKKVKLGTPQNLAVEGPLDISVTPNPLMKTPVETPIEATLRGMTCTRTYGKRSRLKTPTGNDQVAPQNETPVVVKGSPAQIETPIGVKGNVASGADKILIRIKELPEAEKNKKQEALAVHRRKLELVTKKGRYTKSNLPLSSSLIAAPSGNATTHINQSEDKRKEAEFPVILALEARDSAVLGVRKRKSPMTPKKNLNGPSGGKIMEGLNQQTSGGGSSSQRRKRGRPRRLVVAKPPESTAKENDGIKDVANGSAIAVGGGDQTINQVKLPVHKMVKCSTVTPNSTLTVSKGAIAVGGGDQTINQVKLPVHKMVKCSTGSEVSMKEKAIEVSEINCTTNKAMDDDQPLSMWVGGIQSSSNPEDLQLPSTRHENHENLPSVNEVSRDGTLYGNYCLPFVKKSPVWETIESMEVFRITPQKPHFRPLADCKEEYREGSAIGIMVTFASLFDKILSLKFDDSRTTLDSILDSLSDLASHGFDISLPQSRVFQLIDLSTNHDKEKLLRESKDAEDQIKSNSDEGTKLDENINVLEKKIRDLEEQLAGAKSKKEFMEHEVLRLKTRRESVNFELNDARSKFEKVASAPWK